MLGDVLDNTTEAVATQVMDSIYTVHHELGPGLLECVYEESLCFELASRRLKVVRQAHVPITYRGMRLKGDLRLDVLVEDRIIIEIKSVDRMDPVFESQLHTYLKLTGLRLGFLVNFNVRLIKEGVKRIIH